MDNFLLSIGIIFLLLYIARIEKYLKETKESLGRINALISPYLAPVTSIVTSEEFNKDIKFWEMYEKKYWQRYFFNNKKKEKKHELVTNILAHYHIFIEFVNKLNMDVLRGSSQEKASTEFFDKYRETLEEVRKLEEEMRKLDKKIDDKLRTRDLDYEFAREWSWKPSKFL